MAGLQGGNVLKEVVDLELPESEDCRKHQAWYTVDPHKRVACTK